MAIEIKGLKSDALLARANLDKVRAAYRKFNEAAPAHAADVDKLAGDITGMQSDLEFAAAVMGNSEDASERLTEGNGAEKPERPPVVPQNQLAGVGDLNRPKAAPEPIVGQQSPFAVAASTGKPIEATPESQLRSRDARVFDRMG